MGRSVVMFVLMSLLVEPVLAYTNLSLTSHALGCLLVDNKQSYSSDR